MRVAAAVLLAITLLIPVTALADDAALQGTGGALQPMKAHPSVTMEEMRVDLYLNPGKPARVDCHFVFRNTGPATTVRMGFPESAYGYKTDVRHPRGFTSFATWVDGKRVPTKIEGFKAEREISQWSRWRVKTVRFAAGQTRRVRVRYTAPLGETSDGARLFHYRIGTGGSWKGPIGQARVQVHATYRPEKWRMTSGPSYRNLATAPRTWTGRRFDPTPRGWIQITFDPVHEARDTVRLRWPAERALGPDGAEAAWQALQRAAPEWSPPDDSQYSQETLEHCDYLSAPWLAVGDFDGDGRKDAAVYLLRGGDTALAVLQGHAEAGFEVRWLREPPAASGKRRIAHGLRTVLQTRSPGTIAYWKEGEAIPKSGRLDLKHDAIEVMELGRAAMLYHWDSGQQRYSTVQTADRRARVCLPLPTNPPPGYNGSILAGSAVPPGG